VNDDNRANTTIVAIIGGALVLIVFIIVLGLVLGEPTRLIR
jgi:hypothetical protein